MFRVVHGAGRTDEKVESVLKAPLILVAGALANKPGNGGAAWTRLSWALGLKRLGCDVYFVEQIDARACTDAALAWFTRVTDSFGLADTSALFAAEDGHAVSVGAGVGLRELTDVAAASDLLVNISGHLTLAALKSRCRARAFIDLDPGYTQYWHAQGLAEDHLRDHHAYFTVGENIGKPGCDVPMNGIEWRPIRQPVVLDEWPVRAHEEMRFTTVASWRGPYGRVTHDGRTLGLKAHEFRKFVTLPALTGHDFEIALDADPADRQDIDSLRDHDWRVVNPRAVAGDPFAFRRYIQESAAECSVAQGIYVETRTGWFSDRTVRYLASGKPALVQDTGFSDTYPAGLGLVAFRTLDEAARGADLIMRDYEAHARAARAIAEQWFDSDVVLSGLLRGMGVTT
jgi:hypothetical protein